MAFSFSLLGGGSHSLPDARRKRPAYEWYVADALSDEIFRQMTYEQQGIYRALLDHQWIEGSIPADPDEIKTILNWPPERFLSRQHRFTRLWPLIGKKFQPIPTGRLINLKLETQRDACRVTDAARDDSVTSRRHDFVTKSPRTLKEKESIKEKESATYKDLSSVLSEKDPPFGDVPTYECAELKNSSAPSVATLTVLEFPTVGTHGKIWQLTNTQVAEWQSAFPGTDILAEMRKALAWVRANPGRRKTTQGMLRFLVSWLSRAVDQGTGRPVSATTQGSVKADAGAITAMNMRAALERRGIKPS